MNYAPATSKASSPGILKLFLKAALWFMVIVVTASVGLWWFMRSDRGMQWANKVIHERFPDVQSISPAELNAWLVEPDGDGPPPLIIDVRTPDEQAVSILRGARCVAPEDSADTVLASVDQGRPVVVYCTGGFRAATMAQRLMEAGHMNVANLEGGIFGWVNAGFPVERDGIEVSKVHPYSSLFARMVKNREKNR